MQYRTGTKNENMFMRIIGEERLPNIGVSLEDVPFQTIVETGLASKRLVECLDTEIGSASRQKEKEPLAGYYCITHIY